MMLEELLTGSNLLSTALERYQAACLAIANYYDSGNPLKGISQAISDAISSELDLVILYEAKIGQIKATISQTRNIIPGITPISLLPADTLTHIFGLVLNGKPCYSPPDNRTTPRLLVNYPETLSHVCSRWRNVAINSHVLWSHIDLRLLSSDSYDTVGGRFLTRAKVFSARTARAPLEIHIRGEEHFFIDTPADADLNAFCASIATRIQSLELSASDWLQNIHFEALRHCFEHCVQGALHQPVITDNIPNNNLRFETSESFRLVRFSQTIDLPQQRLGDPLLSVQVLRLTGVHFPWTSQVYHRLVELRFADHSDRTDLPDLCIPQSDLARILAASPGLRIFHFSISITELVPRNARSSSVSLRYLEAVDLHPRSLDQYDILLQLLSPGSNPLRLSLAFPEQVTHLESFDHGDFPLPNELFRNEFFSRSMVAELRIHFDGNGLEGFVYTPLVRLLRLLPLQRIQVLSLSNLSLRHHPLPAFDPNEAEHPLTYSQLHTLYLSGCRIELGDFERATEVILIQVLKVANCSILAEVDHSDESEAELEAERELARIFPGVKFE